MPYIKQANRKTVDPEDGLPAIGEQCDGPGELNYAFCRLITGYLSLNVGGRPGYAEWNEVKGVLVCLQEVIAHRFLNPYEDQKMLENGDVFFD
jgi:hypothetical protein